MRLNLDLMSPTAGPPNTLRISDVDPPSMLQSHRRIKRHKNMLSVLRVIHARMKTSVQRKYRSHENRIADGQVVYSYGHEMMQLCVQLTITDG